MLTLQQKAHSHPQNPSVDFVGYGYYEYKYLENASRWRPPFSCQRRKISLSSTQNESKSITRKSLGPASDDNIPSYFHFPIELTMKDYLHRVFDLVFQSIVDHPSLFIGFVHKDTAIRVMDGKLPTKKASSLIGMLAFPYSHYNAIN
jgi:hypothetical protein